MTVEVRRPEAVEGDFEFQVWERYGDKILPRHCALNFPEPEEPSFRARHPGQVVEMRCSDPVFVLPPFTSLMPANGDKYAFRSFRLVGLTAHCGGNMVLT